MELAGKWRLTGIRRLLQELRWADEGQNQCWSSGGQAEFWRCLRREAWHCGRLLWITRPEQRVQDGELLISCSVGNISPLKYLESLCLGLQKSGNSFTLHVNRPHSLGSGCHGGRGVASVSTVRGLTFLVWMGWSILTYFQSRELHVMTTMTTHTTDTVLNPFLH